MILNPDSTILLAALPQEIHENFKKEKIAIYYTGVGTKKAFQSTTEILKKHKPKHVLNLGTAGSHTLPVHTLVEVSGIIHRNIDKMHLEKIEINTLIDSLPKGICGTGDSIETDPLKFKCDLMDMEAFAIASVCLKNNIGFTSVKYITDKSDTQTFESWKAALPKAAESLFHLYEKILK